MKFEDEAASDLWSSAGGKVPDGWSVVRFESFLAGPKAIAVGVMYPGDHVSDGVPCIRLGDVQPGGTVGIPTMNISCEVHSQYVRTEISGDELLITLVGNPGQCVIATPEMAGWNAARALAVARLESPDLRPYLKAVLESAPMKSIVLSMLNTTVQPTLNLKEIRALPVPIPPNWSEAKAIGSFSELIESKIANNRALAADLEAMARAIFKSWFVDFDPVKAKMEGRAPAGMDADTAALFPDELVESELGLIPKGWDTGTLANHAELNPESWSARNHPDMIQYADLAGTDRGQIVETKVFAWADAPSRARRVLRSGDTIVGTVRPGNRAYSYVGFDGLTGSTGFAVLRPRIPSLRSVNYLAATADEAIDRLTNLADGAAYPAVRPDVVLATPVVASPIPVAEAFEKITGPLLDMIVASQAENLELAELRDSLLPRLISGKLRLPA